MFEWFGGVNVKIGWIREQGLNPERGIWMFTNRVPLFLKQGNARTGLGEGD